MEIGAFITMTRPKERGDLFNQCYQMAKQGFDTVTVIDGQKTWPKEFKWSLIGEHFQRGYEQCEADFVFHMDSDFIFHEQDFQRIRELCAEFNDQPAFSMAKRQFILPDRFNVKSQLVVAVNKGKYGNRIRFDSGGDLCQPSLDGKYIETGTVPAVKIGIYNYEKLIKTKEQIKDDVERMARAWHRHFGNWKLGNTETAYDQWYKMVISRFNKPHQKIKITDHPIYMQETIKNLTENQWGYSMFGVEENRYVQSH